MNRNIPALNRAISAAGISSDSEASRALMDFTLPAIGKLLGPLASDGSFVILIDAPAELCWLCGAGRLVRASIFTHPDPLEVQIYRVERDLRGVVIAEKDGTTTATILLSGAGLGELTITASPQNRDILESFLSGLI